MRRKRKMIVFLSFDRLIRFNQSISGHQTIDASKISLPSHAWDPSISLVLAHSFSICLHGRIRSRRALDRPETEDLRPLDRLPLANRKTCEATLLLISYAHLFALLLVRHTCNLDSLVGFDRNQGILNDR